jgi:3-oxoadipate enol-lactonase/4-carboxymuconolactone decarboxylase
VAEGTVGRWVTKEFIDANPKKRDYLQNMIAGTSAEGYAACAQSLAGLDLTGDLAKITARTLVVAGAQDPAFPLDHAARIVGGIKDATLAIIDPGAHLPNLESVEQFNAALLAHLTKTDELYDAGMVVRKEVLGTEHVARSVANTTDFTKPFQDFITKTAWGQVWTRDGLDRKTRSCITLAVLTAIGAEDELAMHVHAAIRNGLTKAEISEVLLHTAVYGGVPRSNSAFAIAKRELERYVD